VVLLLVFADDQKSLVHVLQEIRDVVIENSATKHRKAHLPWLFVEHAEVLLHQFPGGEFFSNCVVDQQELEHDGLHLVVAVSLFSVVSRAQDHDAKSVEAFVTFICLHGGTVVQNMLFLENN
jgi:hypothetical protein